MPRWAWLEENPKKAARLTERIIEGLREVGLLGGGLVLFGVGLFVEWRYQS